MYFKIHFGCFNWSHCPHWLSRDTFHCEENLNLVKNTQVQHKLIWGFSCRRQRQIKYLVPVSVCVSLRSCSGGTVRKRGNPIQEKKTQTLFTDTSNSDCWSVTLTNETLRFGWGLFTASMDSRNNYSDQKQFESIPTVTGEWHTAIITLVYSLT